MLEPIQKALNELSVGESATVSHIKQTDIADRLIDLGLTVGSRVTCTLQSPLGDPKAYLIRGAVIAVRHSDAATVTVTSAPEYAPEEEDHA